MFINSTWIAAEHKPKGMTDKVDSETGTNKQKNNIVENSNKVGRLRQKTIVISLILVIATAFMVFPLSRAIDRHIDAVSSTTELRHLGDHLLLNLISQTEAERGYYLTRNPDYDEQFKESSELIDRNLAKLEEVTRNNPAWHAWYEDVTIHVLIRAEYLKQLMSITRLVPARDDIDLKSQVEQKLRTGDITKLILNFIEKEEHLLMANYARLNLLRTILNYLALAAIITTFVLAYFINQRLKRDVNQLKSYQDLLAKENALLEDRVKERTYELEKATQYAEKEKQRVEFLLQDASHRIGNSLATVSSLLSIQMNQSKNEEVKSALTIARDHIQTIATAHRRLRLSDDMDTADTREFFETIINDIQLSLPPQKRSDIEITTDIENFKMRARDATTLAIITGELMTNAVKHAFVDKKDAKITVKLTKKEDSTINLIIEDNGKGFPPDIDQSRGLGHLIISKLCMQFNTKPIFENIKTGGARVVLALKNLNLAPEEAFRIKQV